MNYVYDINVNMQRKYIDYFEWNSQDNIKKIKKLPIIKVNNKVLNDLRNKEVQLTEDTINRVIRKEFDSYLVMTNENIVVVKFNNEGKNILKSSINYTDELDILENCRNIKEQVLEYTVIKIQNDNFYTRNEMEMMDFLSKEIDKLSVSEDSKKIGYLYLECFNRKENNSSKALRRLKQNIYNHININQIYSFFKLIEQN